MKGLVHTEDAFLLEQRGDGIPREICYPGPHFLGNLVSGAVGTNLLRWIQFPRKFGPRDQISSGNLVPLDQLNSLATLKRGI